MLTLAEGCESAYAEANYKTEKVEILGSGPLNEWLREYSWWALSQSLAQRKLHLTNHKILTFFKLAIGGKINK